MEGERVTSIADFLEAVTLSPASFSAWKEFV